MRDDDAGTPVTDIGRCPAGRAPTGALAPGGSGCAAAIERFREPAGTRS